MPIPPQDKKNRSMFRFPHRKRQHNPPNPRVATRRLRFYFRTRKDSKHGVQFCSMGPRFISKWWRSISRHRNCPISDLGKLSRREVPPDPHSSSAMTLVISKHLASTVLNPDHNSIFSIGDTQYIVKFSEKVIRSSKAISLWNTEPC
jgi:hypothetical protein